VNLILGAEFVFAQLNEGPDELFSNDLNLGGDIFSDFNEDLESSKVMEDERFYRYGRFFSVNVGLGITSFTGNRGLAYTDGRPTYSFAIVYFFNFKSAFTLGMQYSKQTMVVDTLTETYSDSRPGAVVTALLRPFFGYRYYVDTTNLGTAITYANPYITGRMEFWYQTNEFIDDPTIERQKGGGLGVGIGFGLEFPLEIKESYMGVEALYHQVNFFDKDVSDYQQITNDDGSAADDSPYGYDNLAGNVWSVVISYNLTW
jgi:hypothetical protein